jgi:SRSO17 transposase
MATPGKGVATVEEIRTWEQRLEALLARMAPCFANQRGRTRLGNYVRGLLSGVERKNGWQLAEQAGEARPYGMQQFLYRGGWDLARLCRETRQYLAERLGAPDAVLVGDETGFLKKGTHSVGVQRQYSGTAGRIENCQIGVLLGYVSSRGRTLLDRELYLPRSWAEDRARCKAVGVPDDVGFRTKPALLQAMLQRAMDEGVPAQWVVADSVYGDDPKLRDWLAAQRMAYVLGTSVNDAQLPIGGLRYRSLRQALGELPPTGWLRASAGAGSQGPRWYDWQLLELAASPRLGWRQALLVQRSVTDQTDLKVHRCFYPDATTLDALVRVAGCRWTIETDIEEAKGEVGLDHYEVRSWDGWYRHISLAILAYAFLTTCKAAGDAADLAAGKRGLQRPPTTSMAYFKASRGLSSR